MRNYTAAEVITMAEQAAKEDYEKHLPIHTDPDGQTWQVDKNPYCTQGARNDWQRGFEGKPAQPWEGTLDFNFKYQRGAAMARLLVSQIPKKPEFHCWLDPIIANQAAHYGLSVPQFTSLISDAAICQEELEKQKVDKPNELS